MFEIHFFMLSIRIDLKIKDIQKEFCIGKKYELKITNFYILSK